MGATVNPPTAHAELIATFKRAEADAAHKFGLIQAAANKGPKAIQAAAETAAKAAKRRDSFAKKLGDLGILCTNPRLMCLQGPEAQTIQT